MNAQREAQRPSDPRGPALELRVLGPLEASLNGEAVALGPPKQRALLVQLALRAGEAVPVERLIDDLWPEAPPETARHAIQVYVSGLRKALGNPARIAARSRAYALLLEPGELDLERFRSLVADARARVEDEPAAAAERLRSGLAIWRGRALADLDGEPGVHNAVLELEEERLEALELRLDAELKAGRASELVPELERLIAEYPARETLYEQLMLAHYRSGRQADALQTYRRARETLLNELGLEPSPRLKELEVAILNQDPALTPESLEIRARRHLPAQPNAFIGREREVEELVELLGARDVRLLTLTGTGGIGKSRLALAAAGRLAARFDDGVWFVDLSPVSDPALIPTAIAQALRVRERPGERLVDTLAAHLRDKRVLLLLDTFEHVLAAADHVSELLRQAPELTVLATSRARLNLYGEHEYEVRALDVPSLDGITASSDLEQFDSIALFVARARAARRGFSLEEDPRAAVQACVRLEGLPLAIELAAARLSRGTLRELAEGLAHRLDVLTGGPRDVQGRQRTLRATIEWSYALLEAHEQEVFTCLGIFPGGWTLDAASEVCNASEQTLRSLVERSLVQAVGERFTMLDTLREFALDQLSGRGIPDDVHRRGAEYLAALVERNPASETAPQHEAWLERVGSELDNLRALISWAFQAGEANIGVRIVGHALHLCEIRGLFSEGRTWAQRALGASGEPSSARARVLSGAAVLAHLQGDWEASARLADEEISLAEALGDRAALALALRDRSASAIGRGELGKAVAMLERCRSVAADRGDSQLLATATTDLGHVRLMRGEKKQAAAVLQEALDLWTARGETGGVGVVLRHLAVSQLDAAEPPQLLEMLHDSIRRTFAVGFVHQVLASIEVLGAVYVRQGRWHDAVRILSAASTQREAIGAQAVEFLRRLVDRTLGEARGELSERDYAGAWTEGSSLTLEQLVDEALIGDDAGASHVQGRGTPSAAGSA